MNLKGIDEVTYKKIEFISAKRLKNQVSPFDVLTWLTNFKREEYGVALKILEFLDVYTENELIELWDNRLTELFKSITDRSHIVLHPISDYGKSATLMIYYIRKTRVFLKYSDRIEFISSAHQFKKRKNGLPNNSILVLLDDFIGSGKSLFSYYTSFIKLQLTNFNKIERLYSISLFSLNKGDYYIERRIPEMLRITEIKTAAFASRGSVFGHRGKMTQYRNFCYKYGERLFTVTRHGEEPVNYPLGYENSQALIVFPYNPPNNTLPIIWSSLDGWKPLFPRFTVDKISDARKKRKELAYYLSLLQHNPEYVLATGKRDLGWTSITFITNTDFKVFAIIFMLRQRRIKPTICQILGITANDYDLCIQEATQRGLLDPNGKLTEYGESIFEEVLVQLRRERKISTSLKNVYEMKSVKYLPLQFKGRSLTD